MPRIFDNINDPLLEALKDTIKKAFKSDFCVGYFNLRGWKELADSIENWQGGEENCCRLLVGMQRLPQEEIRAMYGGNTQDAKLDNQTVTKIKKRLAK